MISFFYKYLLIQRFPFLILFSFVFYLVLLSLVPFFFSFFLSFFLFIYLSFFLSSSSSSFLSSFFFLSFFLFLSFKTCSHSQREIRTNINEEQNEMLMLMNHRVVYFTLYVQTITINSAQPDFDIEISHCSFSVMRQLISSILVSNERR